MAETPTSCPSDSNDAFSARGTSLPSFRWTATKYSPVTKLARSTTKAYPSETSPPRKVLSPMTTLAIEPFGAQSMRSALFVSAEKLDSRSRKADASTAPEAVTEPVLARVPVDDSSGRTSSETLRNSERSATSDTVVPFVFALARIVKREDLRNVVPSKDSGDISPDSSDTDSISNFTRNASQSNSYA